MPTGDRPIFPLPKQRLDKVDVEAITDLVQETVLRTIGAILGPCEGFLSEVTATYSAPFLTLGACRLAYVSYVSGSDVVMDGGVVSFRPELDPSGGQIDLSPLGGNPGYLFFRRLETDMDEENRAYFDVISQTKRVGAINTRMREIVEFQPAEDLTTYTSAAGWGLCGRIQWGGSVAYFEPISAGEIRDVAGVPQRVMRGYGDSGLGVLWRAGGGPAAQTPVGVIRYLQQIVGMVQHILDKDFTLNELGQQLTPADRQFRWTSYSLARDINELHTDLAAVEEAVQYIGQGVIAVINVQFDTGTETWGVVDALQDYIAQGLLTTGTVVSTTDGSGKAVCSVEIQFASGWIVTGWDALPHRAPLSAGDVQTTPLYDLRVHKGASDVLPLVGAADITMHAMQRRGDLDGGPAYRSALPMTFIVYGHKV